MWRVPFIARDGRVRIGWRLVLYALAFIAATIVSGVARSGVSVLTHATWLGGAAMLVGIVVVQWFASRLLRTHVDRRPLSGLAVPPLSRGWAQLLVGFAVGAAMMGLAFAAEWALGWIRIVEVVRPAGGAPALASTLVGTLLLFLSVGFSEELLMRGALFQNLGEAMPVWAAMVVTGIIFGVSHLVHPGITVGFIAASTFLTASLLVVRLVTGSLWWAIGWHAAWDWLQETVLGLSLGGVTDTALLKLDQRGPPLWVGVAPGIEGGLVYVIPFAVITAGLLAWTWRRGIDLRGRMAPDGSPPVRSTVTAEAGSSETPAERA